MSYDRIKRQLEACSITYLPALLGILLKRIMSNRIFKQRSGLEEYIRKILDEEV